MGLGLDNLIGLGYLVSTTVIGVFGMDSGRFGKRRFGKNMAAEISAKKYAETSQAKNICRNVSYHMWGISGVNMLALTVAKTSYRYDRFAISAPARSLLLFDLA